MEVSNNSQSMENQRSSKLPVTFEQHHQRIRIENPFTLKVAQVFTGFGFGCGVGIGVGRPINMSAIPVVNEVMSATRGATDAFSGVTGHLNNSLRKLGAKTIQAGIGCGVGFGHGFGIGLAIKPSFLQQIQSSLLQAMEKTMMKLGNNPGLPINQGANPVSLQPSTNIKNGSPNDYHIANAQKSEVPETASQNLSGFGGMFKGSIDANAVSNSSVNDMKFRSRTEKVINSFLQNPVFKGENTEQYDEVGQLRLENSLVQMVLMHQKVIQELKEDNEKLRQILVDDLKVPPSKLQTINLSTNSKFSPCSDCFECRRRQRRKRN